jgi:Tol biopolymer transport system component
MMDADGSQQQPCPDPLAYERALEDQRWSPDGAYRVFVGPDAQVRVGFPQDGSSWEISRTGSGIAYDPAWSPVDDRIAFVSNESGDGDEIYVIRSSGEGLLRLTHNEHVWDKFPTWSPDGTRIAFWSNRTGHRQIWLIEADGWAQRNLSDNDFNDWEPVWVR